MSDSNIWLGEFPIYDATGQPLCAGDTIFYRARKGKELRLGKILEVSYISVKWDYEYQLDPNGGETIYTTVQPYDKYRISFKIKSTILNERAIVVSKREFFTNKIEVASGAFPKATPSSGRNRCWNCIRVVKDAGGITYADLFT